MVDDNDPGYHVDRVAQVNQQIVVCPDNGLITWTWRLHAGAQAHEITWRPTRFSMTFHGRDVLADALRAVLLVTWLQPSRR